MRLDKASAEWQQGLQNYLDTTYGGNRKGGTAPCPCSSCHSMAYLKQSDVQRHLLRKGFDEGFIREEESICEGSATDIDGDTSDKAATAELIQSLISGEIRGKLNEDQPNEKARKFFELLQEDKELFPGCTEATKVSFIVKMFQLKCMFGCNACLEFVLHLCLLLMPPGHCLPDSMDKIRRIVRDLGLNYEKIDACYNDCVLFRGDYADLDNCPKCKETRWKETGNAEAVDSSCGSKKRAPRKILRYFPLIPRLQRLYMSAARASDMRWHKEELVVDGKMRHPANSKAWEHVDATYEWFAKDPRNVRLGLASDGFNPFGMLNVSYSCWPVILILYNLPPWLCFKQHYWMMSMIIPGPRSPGVNINVYLQPLIDELKVLWKEGVKTWDAKEKKNFDLHALLLWTINDFPTYAMLSGWSTKGKFACPYCHKDTDYLWLKHGSKHCYMGHRRFLPLNHKWRRNKVSFNNMTEYREAPEPLTGQQVLEQYESFSRVKFGPESRKRKQRDEEKRWHNWRKKSIFFELPYWEHLLIRHNLDVMHIEKNICESILGTLLEVEGKGKDNEQARLDMQHLGIRRDQHPVFENSKFTLSPALYKLQKEDKKILRKFLHEVKLPDGYDSNIRRCVDENRLLLSGLKTHDYHIIFQKLLPLVLRNILPQEVVVPLIDLSRFFSSLCSKELDEKDIPSMSSSIRETLCRLEMIFPPAFFDIMVHLPVHLAEEVALGGPVCYRWMYPVERYLRTVKGYVRNKAHPEGSIAEGYITEECITFCSQFFNDMPTRPERHESATASEPPFGLSVFGRLDYNRKGFSFENFNDTELLTMRHYILTNCDECATLADVHKDLLKKYNPHNVEKRHREQFVRWFEDKTKKEYDQGKASELIYDLSQGPDHRARVFNRCVINGFLFQTMSAEKHLITQNSGVLVKGDETTGNMEWYGVIKKIISLPFPGGKEVMMFQCDWYDVPAPTKNRGRGYKKDQYGIIDIDTTRLSYSNDPYILATQAEQVFYVRDANKSDWCSVVRMKPRNLFSMPESTSDEDHAEVDVDSLIVGVENMTVIHDQGELTNWRRIDMEGETIEASVIQKAIAKSVTEPMDEDYSDEDGDDVDAYIDDGVVAPAVATINEDDDDFFV